MTRAAFSTRRPSTSLARLFARYINGDIAEQAWRRISAVLDAEGTTPEERLAYATYVNDWLDRGRMSRV